MAESPSLASFRREMKKLFLIGVGAEPKYG
jgi:hypothetical protein